MEEKKIIVKQYSFKESAKVLFKKTCDEFEMDSFYDNYDEFEVLYSNGLSRVYYDEYNFDYDCFELKGYGVFYAIFNGFLCNSNIECEHENIERYRDNFLNGDRVLRNDNDVFLNVIYEELVLDFEKELYYESDDIKEY
ncbi:hypothetical protein [Bathymodiolus japonicus methanotrophic gill symbiont]|uniref:hypothetical protein n=1 Tax=Bathymodiolus japonicus methanotrophic gill symbiont TaxID=113269 RepID=UPI001C8D08AD|nr:hypothetical protein [Bathymodiolus japonicus methanotrophic gill symbiont]